MTSDTTNNAVHPYESPRMNVVSIKGSCMICASQKKGGTQNYNYGDTDDWFNN